PLYHLTHTPTTSHHALSLHDALPISSKRLQLFGHRPVERRHHLAEPLGVEPRRDLRRPGEVGEQDGDDLPLLGGQRLHGGATPGDRKSTRLNSSHQIISYAVFCLNKK